MRLAQVACVLGLALASCVTSSAVTCPDGSVCPEGQRCVMVAEQPLCVVSAQIDACTDNGAALADATACEFGDPPIAGTCYGGACLPAGCGNSRLDAGEMCDDGNTFSRDGCSDACTSDESCGNSVHDLAVGETCDDGNRQDHDACSSTCELERPSWGVDSARPPARDGAAMTYHAVRRRVVLFGGRLAQTQELLSDTWEWDGVGWRAKPGLAPFERNGHAVAYDHANQEVVMFGGDASAPSNDTWVWSGAWTVRYPPVSPPVRGSHALAYDSGRRRVVLFGGAVPLATGATRADDTWEWDGNVWTEILSEVRPSSRAGHAMAFDPTRGRIVMFGGQRGVGGGPLPIDTWEFDGTAWTAITPAGTSPTGRIGAAMAFDSTRNKVVMVGGTIGTGGEKAEVWEWDGTTWEDVSVTRGVPGIPTATFAAPSLASDPQRGLVLVANGETWIRAGGTWTPADAAGPPSRSRPAGVLVPSRRLVLMFGGDDGSDLVGDTWVWNGAWKESTSATNPDPMSGPAMAYDSARDEGVLFGASLGPTPNDTFVWRFTSASASDGTWSRITGVASDPQGRRGHVMVYDPSRGEIVMYGGRTGIDGRHNDTWIWNGTGWSERVGVGTSSAREGAAAAYDPIRKTIVLFGGDQQGGDLSDVWEWNGTSWTEITPAVSPRPRRFAGLAWNPARRVLVMAGGLSGPSALSDAWELVRSLDGTARWELLEPIAPLPRRGEHLMVPSIDGHGVSIFHGVEETSPLQVRADVITLRWAGSAADEVCTSVDSDGDALAGCADLDCWAICSPTCEPGIGCDATSPPTCGDGTCSPIEDCATCPVDCLACPTSCGDFACSAGEDVACPGDCAP